MSGVERIGTDESEIWYAQKMLNYCMTYDEDEMFYGSQISLDALQYLDSLVYWITKKIKDKHCE